MEVKRPNNLPEKIIDLLKTASISIKEINPSIPTKTSEKSKGYYGAFSHFGPREEKLIVQLKIIKLKMKLS